MHLSHRDLEQRGGAVQTLRWASLQSDTPMLLPLPAPTALHPPCPALLRATVGRSLSPAPGFSSPGPLTPRPPSLSARGVNEVRCYLCPRSVPLPECTFIEGLCPVSLCPVSNDECTTEYVLIKEILSRLQMQKTMSSRASAFPPSRSLSHTHPFAHVLFPGLTSSHSPLLLPNVLL